MFDSMISVDIKQEGELKNQSEVQDVMRKMPRDTKVTTTNHLNSHTEQHPAMKINPTTHREEAGGYFPVM